MDDRYYWKQLMKIFRVAESFDNQNDQEQLSTRANKILNILKETYNDGHRCGNLKNLKFDLKERSN